MQSLVLVQQLLVILCQELLDRVCYGRNSRHRRLSIMAQDAAAAASCTIIVSEGKRRKEYKSFLLDP